MDKMESFPEGESNKQVNESGEEEENVSSIIKAQESFERLAERGIDPKRMFIKQNLEDPEFAREFNKTLEEFEDSKAKMAEARSYYLAKNAKEYGKFIAKVMPQPFIPPNLRRKSFDDFVNETDLIESKGEAVLIKVNNLTCDALDRKKSETAKAEALERKRVEERLNPLVIEPFDFSREEDKKRFGEMHSIVRDEVSSLYTQMRLAESAGEKKKAIKLQTEVNDKIKSIIEQAEKSYKKKTTSLMETVEEFPEGEEAYGKTTDVEPMDKNQLMFLAASLDTPLLKHKSTDSYVVSLGEDFYYAGDKEKADITRQKDEAISPLLNDYTDVAKEELKHESEKQKEEDEKKIEEIHENLQKD